MAKPRAVLESMAVTLLEITNEDGHLPGSTSRASIMVPSRGNGSVHIPREAARSNVLRGLLLNQMEVTINDDEARN
jgi:hypothetical protein